MLKLTVAALAVVLAGTASAGWRSLRIDGSGEAAFTESLAAFKEKLGPVRAVVFEAALQDIWVQGAKIADADQREYTPNEYFRQIDGLGYNEVVTYTDPTGDTAQKRFRAAHANLYGSIGRDIARNARSAYARGTVEAAHPIVYSGFRGTTTPYPR